VGVQVVAVRGVDVVPQEDARICQRDLGPGHPRGERAGEVVALGHRPHRRGLEHVAGEPVAE
jgi:hypothetical protein